MPKYRVLSLDGGGIKGIITAILLQRLNQHPFCAGWLDSADLLAGTSTGGLLALGLAHGLSPSFMRTIYESKGKAIFNDSWLDDLVDLGKLTGADYSIAPLERELERVFGNTKLKQLRRQVLITAFDLDNEAATPAKRTWKPKLFHNFPGKDSDGDELACRVGLYTSAAPTFFPSVDGYIDGGVYATNPSMCALAQALDRRRPDAPALAEVVLLSLGTGTSLQYIRGARHNWGYAQWIKPLVNLMLDGVAGVADFQCRQLLGERYHRLGPVFPPGIKVSMDDANKIPFMIRFADQVPLDETAAWLRDNWC